MEGGGQQGREWPGDESCRLGGSWRSPPCMSSSAPSLWGTLGALLGFDPLQRAREVPCSESKL